jgi:predicted dinucleotide-binding enzyme
MKIAVIGDGNVGGALGDAWARAGHEVVFGVRDVNKAPAAGSRKTAPTAQAIRDAEVVALAVPWAAVPDVIKQFDGWSKKVLLDCTNPIAPGMELAVGLNTSGGEQVASLAKSASVVKAFNTTGFGNMQNPIYAGKPVSMLFCTDDEAAQKIGERLIRDVGFEPVFAGPLKLARYFEPLAMLWISMTPKLGLNFAFTLVRR